MNEEKFRCHPSIIIEKTWAIVTIMFFFIASKLSKTRDLILEGDISSILNQFRSILPIILIFLIITIIIIIYNIISWSKFFIYIDKNTIVIEKNSLNSKKNTFGIKHISNINFEQNLFEKIINTCKVKIDTDTLSTADTTDIEIILSQKKANEFKNTIINILNNEKNLNKDVIEPLDEIEEENQKLIYDVFYAKKDILKHCFYNLSILGLIVNILIISVTIFIAFYTNNIKSNIALIILVITSLVSIVKYFFGDLLKFYNFSVKRKNDKLYINYGLFESKKFVVSINRINAINITQSLISRLFNVYQCNIVAIGIENDKCEPFKLLLSVKRDDLIKYLKILFPEVNINNEIVLKKQNRNIWKINIFNIIMTVCLSSLLLYIIYKLSYNISIITFFVVEFIIFFIFVFINYMSYSLKGIYFAEKYLIISSGILNKKISLVKYKKIQWITIYKGLIASRFKICKGKIHILASNGEDEKILGYYENKVFDKLKYKLLENTN